MPQGQRGAGISWPQRGEVSVDAASTTTELDGSGVVVAPRWLTQLSAGHILVGDSGVHRTGQGINRPAHGRLMPVPSINVSGPYN